MSGDRLGGSVISSTFECKGDYERQRMLMDTLEDALGSEAAKKAA